MPNSLLHGRGEGLQPSSFQSLLPRDDLDELDDVLTAARALMSVGTSPPIDQIDDFASATHALHQAWELIVGALTGDKRAREHVLSVMDLAGLLGRVEHLGTTIRDAEFRRRHEALNIVRSALARLQSVDSLAELVQLAPEVICGLGFDRAIISRVENSIWVTQTVHVTGDAEWAASIERIGQQNPQPLGPTIRETEIVRRRVPVLVKDVQHAPDVHRSIADASLSRSYVAAPVMLRSNVVGFLHGDRYFHRGDTDTFDRDMLAVFAEGLSYALERTVLQTRLSDLRSDVRRITSGVDAVVDRYSDDVADVVTLADTRVFVDAEHRALPVGNSADALAARLTRRELEIVHLLANGETNTRIASKLVLAEATVKSHVKHILRKLGAANRAEAVSKWLLANAARR